MESGLPHPVLGFLQIYRQAFYNVTKLDNQINDKGTVKYNVIFQTTIQRKSYRGHSPL
jgi:hypothetical protein